MVRDGRATVHSIISRKVGGESHMQIFRYVLRNILFAKVCCFSTGFLFRQNCLLIEDFYYLSLQSWTFYILSILMCYASAMRNILCYFSCISLNKKFYRFLYTENDTMQLMSCLSAGYDNGFRSIILSAVSRQVESCNFRNVRPMQGARTGKMSDSTLWAAGTTSAPMDEEDIELLERAVERVCHASWRIH